MPITPPPPPHKSWGSQYTCPISDNATSNPDWTMDLHKEDSPPPSPGKKGGRDWGLVFTTRGGGGYSLFVSRYQLPNYSPHFLAMDSSCISNVQIYSPLFSKKSTDSPFKSIIDNKFSVLSHVIPLKSTFRSH